MTITLTHFNPNTRAHRGLAGRPVIETPLNASPMVVMQVASEPDAQEVADPLGEDLARSSCSCSRKVDATRAFVPLPADTRQHLLRWFVVRRQADSRLFQMVEWHRHSNRHPGGVTHASRSARIASAALFSVSSDTFVVRIEPLQESHGSPDRSGRSETGWCPL